MHRSYFTVLKNNTCSCHVLNLGYYDAYHFLKLSHEGTNCLVLLSLLNAMRNCDMIIKYNSKRCGFFTVQDYKRCDLILIDFDFL